MGLGVTKDEVEAVKWYRKGAEQGSAQAQNNLGQSYRFGLGTAVDRSEAVKWYRKAAMQGLPEAQHNIGECYRTGFGLAEDQVEAYAFWNLAGASYERSRADLAIMERGMSAEARARGQQRTKELQKEIEANIAAK